MSLPHPVRLWDQPQAPNPRRVNVFIAEKGLDIARETVNLMEGEHRSERFRAATGGAQVPALELSDGTVLVETQAICRYLEALAPEPNMMGADPLEQAVIEMWQRRVEFGLWAAVTHAFRHLNPKMGVMENQCADWGRTNEGRIDDELARLDTRLAGRDWIAADRPTVADITALVAVDFLRILKRGVPERLENLRAWHQRMSARPSARAGLKTS